MYRAQNIHTAFFELFLLITFYTSVTLGQPLQSEDVSTAENLNMRANVALEEGDFVRAIDLSSRAIALAPRFAEAHVNLGTAYVLHGQPANGAKHIETGLELAPGLYKAHNQLGVAYDRLGRSDDAIEQFQKSIAIKRDYAMAHFNLGVVYAWSGRVKLSEEALRTAVKLDPRNIHIQLYLAGVHAIQKQFKEAITVAKKVVKENPENEYANLVLCTIYLLADDRSAALEMYQAQKVINTGLADQLFQKIFRGRVVSAANALQPK